MKRIVCLIFIFIVGAAGMLWADNKMQMVTYFPVPYVAYSQVNVSKQLDIGLGTVASSIYLGSARSNSAGLRSLYIGTANLNRGILSLNSGRAVVGNGVVMGSGSGVAQFDFGNNLRIGTLNNGYSIEADKMELEELNLFPERVSTSFPSCASTGAEGAPQISWQKLKLKDKEETFLVCGNLKDVSEQNCSDRNYKLTHKSECCPNTSLSDTDCWNCNNSVKRYEPAPTQERLCALQAGKEGEVFLQWYSSMGVPGVSDPSSWCDVDQNIGYLTLCPDKNIVQNNPCTEEDGVKVCVIPNKAGYNAYNPTYSSGGYIYESQGCGIDGNSRHCMIGFSIMVCKESSSCSQNGW